MLRRADLSVQTDRGAKASERHNGSDLLRQEGTSRRHAGTSASVSPLRHEHTDVRDPTEGAS